MKKLFIPILLLCLCFSCEKKKCNELLDSLTNSDGQTAMEVFKDKNFSCNCKELCVDNEWQNNEQICFIFDRIYNEDLGIIITLGNDSVVKWFMFN
ncbi:MAG: hypothetical protein H6552_00355 [Chitinophagales bacterium]|nr:hypothetical protein [Chitinophagales bacterium]